MESDQSVSSSEENEVFVLPSKILQKLTCANCSLYLSVAPIMYTSDQNLVCGRCKNQTGNSLIRAKAFEIVAECLLFPCQYVERGCKKKELSWNSVYDHEVSCNYQDRRCPSGATCQWEGSPKTLLEHFKEDHEDSVLNVSQFSLPVDISGEKTMLITFSTHVFLLVIRANQKNGKRYFGVVHIASQSNKVSRNFTYTLTLTNSTNQNHIKLSDKVKFNCKWSFDQKEMLEIDVKSIESIFKTSSVLCFIYFSSGTNQKKTDGTPVQILSKDIQPQSPGAGASTKETNLVVPKELLNYPCKNERYGCTFLGSSDDIDYHNNYCPLLRVCPLKEPADCKWKGSITNLLRHVKELHSSTCIDVEKVVKEYFRSPVHMMFYEEQLFKVRCKYPPTLSGAFSWTFHQVGLQPNKVSPFRFEIQFKDQSDTGRKFIIDALCKSEVDDEDWFKSSLTIPSRLLKPFIKNRILKCAYIIYKT